VQRLVLVLVLVLAVTSASADVVLQQQVVSNGGTRAMTSGIRLEGTVGQVAGPAASVDASLYGGFWNDIAGVILDASGVATDVPLATVLGPIWPNPATRSTSISVTLAEPAGVTLEIFDVAGRRIAILLDDVYPAGTWAHRLDVRALPAGVYAARLRVGDRTETRRVTLVR